MCNKWSFNSVTQKGYKGNKYVRNVAVQNKCEQLQNTGKIQHNVTQLLNIVYTDTHNEAIYS